MRQSIIRLTLLGSLLVVPAAASAHVVVTPNTANVADEVTFSISSPNERDDAITSIKLELPKGLDEVTPTVHNGWTITQDDSSITWTAGSIPAGQRDDFSFNAQVPAKASELDWKAYQTYGDGTVVSWDQKPSGSDDATGNTGPYSVTEVKDDLAAKSSANKITSGEVAGTALALSILALAACTTTALRLRR